MTQTFYLKYYRSGKDKMTFMLFLPLRTTPFFSDNGTQAYIYFEWLEIPKKYEEYMKSV